MKKVISLLILALSINSYADECINKLENRGWPLDKHQVVLSCKKISTHFGNDHKYETYDRLCFSVTKTQSSNYKDTWYQTLRYHSDTFGEILNIVAVDSNGTTDDDSRIEKEGNRIILSNNKSSFEFNQNWIERSIVDTKSLNKVTYEVWDKGFFSKELIERSVYTCSQLPL